MKFSKTLKDGYKHIDELPKYGKELILRLIERGAIESTANGNIDLPRETYDTLIILAKLGII